MPAINIGESAGFAPYIEAYTRGGFDLSEISKILDKQNIRFEIDQNHRDSAVMTIPKHRIIPFQL
jgi:hypothetical protein